MRAGNGRWFIPSSMADNSGAADGATQQGESAGPFLAFSPSAGGSRPVGASRVDRRPSTARVPAGLYPRGCSSSFRPGLARLAGLRCRVFRRESLAPAQRFAGAFPPAAARARSASIPARRTGCSTRRFGLTGPAPCPAAVVAFSGLSRSGACVPRLHHHCGSWAPLLPRARHRLRLPRARRNFVSTATIRSLVPAL